MADRHYNRQSVGAANFVPPGRCLVLTASTATGRALWVTSWQLPDYVKHAWPDAWVCSLFRNEGAGVASELIRHAVACTRYRWNPPAGGMVTFLDRQQVQPIRVRGRRVWGRTWALAGFQPAGETQGGLLVLHLPVESMPPAAPWRDYQLPLL